MTKEQEKYRSEPSLWKEKIKALGIEAPLVILFGVVIGIIIAYIFVISKPDFFIRPMIDNMVSATLSAQLSTHTPTQQAVTVPSTADTTSIEEMPLSIYIYQGRDTVGDYGSAWINYLVREDGETVTEFKYSLPEQEQGS